MEITAKVISNRYKFSLITAYRRIRVVYNALGIKGRKLTLNEYLEYYKLKD